jgi:plastocyanin
MDVRAIFLARMILLLAFVPIAIIVAWTRGARAEETMVRIGNFIFDPPVLRVKAGTAVTWTN